MTLSVRYSVYWCLLLCMMLGFVSIHGLQHQQVEKNIPSSAKLTNEQQQKNTSRITSDSEWDVADITAYVIPHSHCDPGWLVPFMDYYNESVSKIIPNAINYLSQDPTKRFIWVETSFFRVWYQQQNSSVKETVKKLATETKQLEFIGGGYVMNDEACSDLPAVINQMTEGHQYLLQNIGVKPRIGWQIDPFGAAKSTATLFRLMGFDYHVINRIDDRLKYTFEKINNTGKYETEKLFEFYWKASDSYGERAKIFTHILPRHYSPPEYCTKVGNDTKCFGFDFEADVESNPPVTPDNLHERAMQLSLAIKQQASWFRTSNVLIPFGNDFRFVRADLMFDNMDKLINEISTNSSYGIHIKYATLSEYFDKVTNDSTVSFPEKEPSDEFPDYFPYTNCWGSEVKIYNNCIAYWSGYFTTYPDFKQMVRKAENLLRTTEILFVLGQSSVDFRNQQPELLDQYENALNELRRAVALAQHHDAITGTMKTKTKEDYEKRISDASQKIISLTPSVIANIYKTKFGTAQFTMDYSVINSITSSAKFIPIVLLNSLGWDNVDHVSIPVSTSSVQLKTNLDNEPPCDVIERTKDSYELLFVGNTPAIGYNTYIVSAINSTVNPIVKDSAKFPPDNEIYLQNDNLKLLFSLTDGQLPYVLRSVTLTKNGKSIALSQKYLQYTSWEDGAYLFVPKGDAEEIRAQKDVVTYKLFKGTLFEELEQVINQNITQRFRIYKQIDMDVIDFISTVITGDDKEMITRFDSNLQTEGEFFTDNYGFEMVKRNRKIKWGDDSIQSFISGNYHPFVSTAFIRDEQTQITVFTKHTMGASSLKDGSLEVMLNRNTLTDDRRGVGQKVSCLGQISVPLRILINTRDSSESLRPKIYQRFEHPPMALFVNTTANDGEDDDWISFRTKYKTQLAPFSAGGLPENIHLLTLQYLSNMDVTKEDQQWDPKVLLRLQHLYEKFQDDVFARETRVRINSIFSQNLYVQENLQEMTLSLNEHLPKLGSQDVVLKPLEIRTFVMNLNSHQEATFNIDSFVLGVACVLCVILVGGTIIWITYQIVVAARAKFHPNNTTKSQYQEI